MRRRYDRLHLLTANVELLEDRALLSASDMASMMLPAPANHPMQAAIVNTAPVHTDILSNLNGAPSVTASTVPGNGDVNPYGTAFVPAGFPTGGKLQAGDLLVSNFNNSNNLQGTGTTIERITPTGQTSTFFQGSNLGLTTALTVLKSGFVIVGNVPTTDGTTNTIHSGSLLILDKNGHLVETLTNPVLLDGPWDMTAVDNGSHVTLFVSNVLDGLVSRIDLTIPGNGGKPFISSETVIASGYTTAPNQAALVVGPTGLAFDASTDTLFVASTGDNAIYAIHNALKIPVGVGRGTLVYKDPVHLHGPLGLVLTPGGNLITANGDAINANSNQNSELVEFSTKGKFISEFQVDPGAGGAFGIAIDTDGGHVRFAAVDDVTNSVTIWTLPNGVT